MNKIIFIYLLLLLPTFCFAQKDTLLHPIVSILDDNCLMGAFQNDLRLSDSESALLMQSSQVYRVYSLNGFLGNCIGTPPVTAPVPCPENYRVTFSPPLEGVIAIGGTWNALPRLPKLVSSDPFKSIVKKIVKQYGILKPKISGIETYKVDLNGDKKDEFIVSARFFKNGVQESSKEGEYSMVFVKSKSDIIMVSSNFYTQEGNYNLPIEHKLSALIDSNGDGNIELLVRSRTKEGTQSSIYRIHDKRAELLLFCACGM